MRVDEEDTTCAYTWEFFFFWVICSKESKLDGLYKHASS